MKFLVKDNSPLIFDVGANIGSTLVEFKKYWPNSIVHCFEPQEECWRSLDNKIKDHNYKNVFVNKYAVGDKFDNQAIFYSHDLGSGKSGFNKMNTKSNDSINLDNLKDKDLNSIQEYVGSLNHERNVRLVRLIDYMNEVEVEYINLLKIDTQGYEPEVLQGMGQKLSNVEVVITELMFFDFYEKSLSFSDIEKYLIPAGFHLYDINYISKNPMNGRTDWVDVIYVNKNRQK